MSLARSLTSRMRARFEENPAATPNRAFSTKGGPRNLDKNIDRRLISLPVELLSTSNAQAYEAPDIKSLIDSKPSQPLSPSRLRTQHSPLSPVSEAQQQLSPHATCSSASSTRSWGDEDGLSSPALTSASSVTSHAPSREPSPATCDPSPMSKSFFLDGKDESKEKEAKVTVMEIQPESPEEEQEPKEEKSEEKETRPAIPQRSATHTKETHQTLARARSQSRLGTSPRQSTDETKSRLSTQTSHTNLTRSSTHSSSQQPPRSSTHSHQSSQSHQAPQLPPVSRLSSTDLFSSKSPTSAVDHPFGAELAKVNELVEELGKGNVAIVDEETQYLMDNGFRCFGASEYILEIQPLFSRAFGEPALPVIAEWI